MNPREFAIDLAASAAEIISDTFRDIGPGEWKSDGTPVTATDRAINALVVRQVAERYPEHAVVGEEESIGDPTDSEYTWVCDPLDGTVPFIQGIPISTFSLALTQGGESILAVVMDPFLQNLYVAEKGLGSTLNGAPLQVSQVETLEGGLVTLEAPYSRPEGSRTRREIRIRGGHVLSYYSYVYSGCLVSSGKLLGAIYGSSHPWDVAAVALIVTEAGGRVTSLQGEFERYDSSVDGLVASNGRVHSQLLDAIAKDLEEAGDWTT